MKLSTAQKTALERFGREVAQELANAELELIKARGRFQAVEDIFPQIGLAIPEVPRLAKLRK
jgi:hypothetical protein